MNRVVNIRIPEDLRAQLMALSREAHVPFSNLVRDSLREYLAVRQFQKLRGKVLPFAEARGFLTDEDVFKNL